MKQKEKIYDIFISYRRNGGFETARLIYDRLTNLGYRVSFDLETLRSGKFNTQLYERIEQCKDVLVLLSSNALELREDPTDDWFRLEVAYALKHQKNIIPIFLRDFNWPDKKTLPDDIADLCDYEGVSSSDEHFDSTFAKLSRLMKSKPHQIMSHLRIMILAVLLIFGMGMSAYCFHDKLVPYPFTKVQKQHFSEVVYLLGNQGNYVNQLFSMKKELLDAANNALSSDSRSHFLDAYNVFLHNWKNMEIEKGKPSEELLKKIQDTPFEIVDVNAGYDYLQLIYKEAKQDADNLKGYINREFPMPKSELHQYIQIKKDYLALQMKYYSYIQMAIFKDVSPKRMGKYKEIVRQWNNLPRLAEPWEHDEKNLKDVLEHCLHSMEEKLKDLSILVGNMNNAVIQDGEEYKQQLIEMGATPEKAEEMLEKVRQMAALKASLDERKKHIDEIREKARTKFAPLETDEPGVLWGKTVRFLSLEMPDEALKVMDMLRKKADETFSLPVCDAMAAYIKQRVELHLAGGVIVCAFEPPATSHAIYKVGDIVTMVDGKSCLDFDTYKAAIGDDVKVQFWRLENGKLVSHEMVMPKGQPRTGMLETLEKID